MKAQTEKTGGSWFFDGQPVRSKQGWKLYISASLLNFPDVLDAVRPPLYDHQIPFKYAASDRVLRKLNAGLYGYSQIGKNIVCYLEERGAVKNLLNDLMEVLEPFRNKAPEVPLAQPIGGGYPLYYRFGAFVGETITIDGETVNDDRTMPASSRFPQLENPFEPFHMPEWESRDFNRFLLRFPVYETIGQGGKGGIFAAFDTEADSFTDIILKIGYRNGQILPDGQDGMDLLRHEYGFFKLLEQNGLSHVAPRLISFAEFENRNVLAMDRIEGRNLAVLRAANDLSISDIENCLALMQSVHDAGLYLGDAKLANFVRDGDGRIWALDFECAGEGDSPRSDLLRTFHFSDISGADSYFIDRIHLLFTAAFNPKEKASFSETDRILELRKFVEVEKGESELEIWALEQLRSELRNCPES